MLITNPSRKMILKVDFAHNIHRRNVLNPKEFVPNAANLVQLPYIAGHSL